VAAPASDSTHGCLDTLPCLLRSGFVFATLVTPVLTFPCLLHYQPPELRDDLWKVHRVAVHVAAGRDNLTQLHGNLPARHLAGALEQLLHRKERVAQRAQKLAIVLSLLAAPRGARLQLLEKMLLDVCDVCVLL